MELADIQRELKSSVAPVMEAFETFKSTNEENLKKRDVVLEEKLTKINTTLDQYEGISQKLTLLDGQTKALADIDKRFDEIETMLKRSRTGDDDKPKSRVNDWARGVVNAIAKGELNLPDEQRKAIEAVNAEHKALSISPATAGGYLAPNEFVREIIKSVTEVSPVRSLARVRQTANKSVEIPKRTGLLAGGWVAELGTKTADATQAYGLEEIPTSEYYALIDISNQMLEDSAFNMEAEIATDSTETFASLEGAAFVTGSGVGKPEGFMTNASVSNTVSGTAATIADANGQANGLIDLKHAIKTAYTANGTWVMNRTTLGSVRKLKDGQNNYIWMPGIAQGKPNTIDGDPYVEMPDMPSEGAGNFPIAYGDFRRAYTWIDRIVMEMLRDPYTQATAGNVRFIMRKRAGGQVVLAEAIRKLKCST